MKKSILFCFLLLAAMATFATPVGKERAARVAQNAVALFCAELHNTDAKQPIELIPVSLGMEPKLYIFNYRNNDIEGFIIVSGDDMADPVLAFSDEGMLDLSGSYDGSTPAKNPAFNDHLLHYMNQIDLGREAKVATPAHVALKWQKLESGNFQTKGDLYHDQIDMLLGNMKWGQSAPYNRQCPGTAITGCVATAFGMIMNYWDYPQHGFGQHTYNGNDNPAAYPDWRYGALSADFENTYYNWQHMPDYIFQNSNSTDIQAIATLLFHIGVALEMRYSPEGSMSWSLPEYAAFDTSLHLSPFISAPNRLRKHFGYKYSYAGMRDSVHNDTLWLQMLYNSLASGKPIYYAGWAKDTSEAGHSGTAGHGYVLDGYFSDEIDSNYFHINWGWNGNADGLFKLDAMRPSNNDFTQWHGAVIGFEPDTSYHGYNPLSAPVPDASPVSAYALGGTIVAHGVASLPAAVYDIMGRCIASRPAIPDNTWTLPATPGVYIVRLGHYPATKVIVTNK